MPLLRYLATTVLAAYGVVHVAVASDLDFNRDIRPILSDRCFACHGPDSASREADLRLDTYDGATDWVIVPGEADESEFIARISSDDPDLVMPPPAAERPPISPEELGMLRRWINSGAEYQAHWAYLPVERREPPPATSILPNKPPGLVFAACS